MDRALKKAGLGERYPELMLQDFSSMDDDDVSRVWNQFVIVTGRHLDDLGGDASRFQIDDV